MKEEEKFKTKNEIINPKNACFIDGQNLYYSFVKTLGIEIDWVRFRVFLKEKHRIDDAYYFIGFFQDNIRLYTELQKAGFVLVFKPITKKGEEIKGNVDGDLIAFAAWVKGGYEQVSIIANDGDYHRLAEFLNQDEKLHAVFATRKESCSWLLRKKAGNKMIYLENSQNYFKREKSD